MPIKTPSKRQLFFTTLIILAFCTEYFFHSKIQSLLEKTLIKEISANKIDVNFDSVDYGYLPPHISLENVNYSDKATVFSAAYLSLSIKVLPLIKGNIELNKLSLSKASASFKVPKKSKKNTPLPELNLQSILKTLPLEKISVNESKAILFLNDDIINLDIETATITKLYNKLQLETKSIVQIRNQNIKEKLHLNTKFRWQETGFFLNFVTLQKENSIAQVSGSLKKEILTDFKLNTKNIYQNIDELRIKLNLDLSEVDGTLSHFLKDHIPPKSPVKTFSGRLQASGYYYNSAETDNKSIFNFQGNDLKTPFFSLFKAEAKGELRDTDFSSDSLDINLSEGTTLSFKNLKLRKKQNSYYISAELKSKLLRVEDILHSLNLKAGNISIPVSIDAKCGGLLFKKTLLKCTGSGDLLNLDIFNSKSGKIISVNKLSANFKGAVTRTDFSFDANASYIDPASSVKSNGVVSGNVNYISGFDVAFETEPVNLSFINEISGQKLTGVTSLTGTSRGSSKWGEINASLDNQNFQFNEFFLGKNSAILAYKFPYLKFSNISGELLEGSNKYSGLVSLNVEKTNLLIDVKGKNASDHGIRSLFEDLFPFPEQINFDSDFAFSVKNGIDINKMDLDFKTKLKNINMFSERFVSGDLHLQGKQGKWKILNGILNKEEASFVAIGELDGFKNLDIHVDANKMNLRDSNFLKQLNLKLSGPAEIYLTAKGPIKGPEALGHVRLINTRGPRENNMGNSDFDYRLYEDSIFVKGRAFNNTVAGEGYYPITEKGSLSYKGNVKNLNLLNFVNLNSQNAPDTQLLLSTKSDFEVKNVSKNSPKGSIENTQLELISENQSLLSLNQVNGKSFARPINFTANQVGHKANLSVNFSRANESHFKFDGDLVLDFLKPFIPTCEFIRGDFSSKNISLTSNKYGVKTSGEASIRSAGFKSDAFPYSFNQISTDIKLNKNEISFSNIAAALANTFLKGSGFIALSPNGANLNFKFNYRDLKIEFPPKISTKTHGSIQLSGNKLPLRLGGELIVTEGLFSQDILSSNNSETITPNKRLPKKILKKATPPATLDVKVYIKDKMRIKNSEADGYAYGFLKASGNPVDPVLDGSLRMKPGLKINFHDKEFLLTEGLLTYKKALTTNPDIFIDASSDIIDSNDPLEKSYALRMLVKGKAEEPDIKFSSQPSLEERQIISLLTIGTISTQSLGQEITATEQATYSGLQFGSYLMQKNQAVKDLQKQTGVQIGLTSSVSAGGVNPKVVVKKAWTPKSSSTLSQTFGNQKSLSFTTEYKLNKKTSTFLDIQNNQTDDASQLINRRVQQGTILDLGLKYKFEFD